MDKSPTIEQILYLTLEAIHHLTGESPSVKSGDHDMTITLPPLQLLQSKRINTQKILEVTQYIIELLMGEVPLRCQDVAVYFAMEEWEYLEGHKDLYKDVMMDNKTFSYVGTGKNYEMILNHTLEIINLLTSKTLPSVKSGDHVTITVPSAHLLTPEKNNDNKILQVTKKIVELLTGEVPIRCQDVTVYFSMEEWEYLEGHKELYNAIMMVNQPALTSEVVKKGKKLVRSKTVKKGKTAGSKGDRNFMKEHSISSQGCSTEAKGISQRSPRVKPVKQHIRSKRYRADKSRVLSNPKKSSDVSRSVKKNIYSKDRTVDHSPKKSKSKKPSRKKSSPVESKDEKLFPCPECDKCFNRKSHLIKHQCQHTGMYPYSCSECEKAFRDKSGLVQHQRIHTNETPYCCSECGSCFKRSSCLMIHLRVHTGETPFSCSECGKCYKERGSLLRHQKTHTGERPHTCEICGRGFIRKGTLLQHERTHSNKCPFTCPECGKQLKYKFSLSKHLKLHKRVNAHDENALGRKCL